jgi:hypothetical protein
MSIGDNDFDASADLDPQGNVVFWILWVIILYVTCIIFLNFIIAEACASYERVSQNINNYLQYQKTTLIHESEDMLWPGLGHDKNFPKFLIVRQIED